jgi:hypothetical protein
MNRQKRKTPPGRSPAARCERRCKLGFDGVVALAVFAFRGNDGQTHLLADCGASHIMHMLRNLSRFTINGSICSGRVFLSFVECGARTGSVWFASRPKETPLPFPLG